MSSQTLAVPGPNSIENGSLFKEIQEATVGWPAEKLAMAALFAKGVKKSDVVKKFVALGYDGKKTRQWQRTWKKEQAFGDLVWALCMEDMRLAEPTVVMALLKKAGRGDVLAAKFFLELTGRYSPKPENVQASVINLVVPTAIDRPAYAPETSQTDDAQTIRGEVLREE